jgi:hypothetical protein
MTEIELAAAKEVATSYRQHKFSWRISGDAATP